MAIVNKVDLKHKVGLHTSIKYQIVTYCFFNGITISKSDLEFLAILARNPNIEISKFCNLLTDLTIFKSSQSARNAISKAEKKLLINKKGKNKSMLGNIAKRTYNGYAKSESITENIKQMTTALEQLEKDILNKKKFKENKNG